MTSAAVAPTLDPSVILDLQVHSAPALRWRSPDSGGDVKGLVHLRSLLQRIGSSRHWVWVVISPAATDDSRFAQACGHAAHGLVVELGQDEWPFVIAPSGSRTWPRSDIGSHDWQYFAAPGELHTVGASFGLFVDWLYDGSLDRAYTRRDVDDRGAAWK